MTIPRRFTMTRQELYKLVWTKPLGEVAAELGITKPEVDSLCCWHKVPRPWSGYWRLKALNMPAAPAPLPDPEKDGEFEIRPNAITVRDRELRRQVASEMIRIGESDLFTVRESLRGCHRLVSRSNKLMKDKKSRPWMDNGQISSPEGSVNDRVSQANVRRALLLMDALLRGFEGLGYGVGLDREGRGATFVELMGVRVHFNVREYWAIKELEKENPDPLEGEYGIPKERRRIKLVPAGRLRLEYRCIYESRHHRQSCFESPYDCFEERLLRDEKNSRLEESLKAFACEVVDMAACGKEALALAERREQEKWETYKRKQEEERLRAIKLAEILAEQARVDALIAESERWEKSNRLRDYIKAKMARAEAQGKDVGPNSAAGKWRKWALDQADRLDPLKKSPPSILDTAE